MSDTNSSVAEAQIRYGVESLLLLMRRLRTPGSGCPWDLEQDYLSITPSTIEEAYEVVDAIEREDYEHLKEELGDLLFQVVFYAQLANEEQRFDFDSIVHSLTAKLIRRHPHVFPDGTLQGDSANTTPVSDSRGAGATEVLKQWEQIKAEERGEKGFEGILDDVPLALPALQRAQKLQKRVAKAGMDWRDVNAILSTLESEIAELREALLSDDPKLIEDELGDVIFTAVNIARHLKLDADQTLRKSNQKFELRIKAMEALFANDGCAWQDLSDAELDAYWAKAKRNLRSL